MSDDAGAEPMHYGVRSGRADRVVKPGAWVAEAEVRAEDRRLTPARLAGRRRLLTSDL